MIRSQVNKQSCREREDESETMLGREREEREGKDELCEKVQRMREKGQKNNSGERENKMKRGEGENWREKKVRNEEMSPGSKIISWFLWLSKDCCCCQKIVFVVSVSSF